MVKLAVTELEVMEDEEGPKGLDELVKIFKVMLRCGPTLANFYGPGVK